jgi:hypothetical protein
VKVPGQTLPLPAVLGRWLALLYCLLLTGCPTVQFVSDYDEEIDRGITAFQKQIERHLAVMERAVGTPAGDFSRSEELYETLIIDLSLLKTRAALAPKNEITVQQLDLLIRNVGRLAAMHREGLEANDLPPLRTAFSTSCTAIIKFELAKKRGEKP